MLVKKMTSDPLNEPRFRRPSDKYSHGFLFLAFGLTLYVDTILPSDAVVTFHYTVGLWGKSAGLANPCLLLILRKTPSFSLPFLPIFLYITSYPYRQTTQTAQCCVIDSSDLHSNVSFSSFPGYFPVNLFPS